MTGYFTQKAQQSLEELCTSESIEDRLSRCKIHLRSAANPKALAESPSKVRERVAEFLGCDIANNPSGAALILRGAIQAIFEESGRNSGHG